MSAMVSLFERFGALVVWGTVIFDLGLLALVLMMRQRIRRIFRDGSLNVEHAILTLRTEHDALEKTSTDFQRRIAALEAALPQDIRRVGLVRFNPFSDAGGDQSFSLALLNDHKDGVVISSLYGREMNRVYAKPVERGNSKYSLSDEERQAIERAMCS